MSVGDKFTGRNWPFSESVFTIGEEYLASNGETHKYAGVIWREKILRQHTPEGPEYIPAGHWIVNENGDVLFSVQTLGEDKQ